MKRHDLDPFSLVFGATFLTVGLSLLLARVNIATLHLHWIWPIPLIVLGALIIFLAARGEREPERHD